METVIDYSPQLDLLITHVSELKDILSSQSLVMEQTNYLIMFLFGAMVAITVIMLLKGLI